MKLALLLLLAACAARADFEQQLAALGDLPTAAGGVIRDCKLGYRTAGRLNAAKSNAILFPTWFSGKSEALGPSIGPGKLADTNRFFVIAVDALGNGASSSPSNTPDFPRITIGDMVRAEYLLATKVLGLTQLHAVMGISMGGMQTFEWMTAYPGFAAKAVPIIGSPKLAVPDLLLWQAQLSVIEHAEKSGGDLREAMKAVLAMHQFALHTPDYRRSHTPPAEWETFKSGYEAGARTGLDPRDWAAQLRAMMSQDVFRRFGGSVDQASAAVRAKTLVVVATQDHMVNPQPAIDWARTAGFALVELTGHCGHMATGCEAGRYQDAVKQFLEN